MFLDIYGIIRVLSISIFFSFNLPDTSLHYLDNIFEKLRKTKTTFIKTNDKMCKDILQATITETFYIFEPY